MGRAVRLLLFLLIILQVLGAGAFVHWRGDYEAARGEAVQTRKKLLLLLVKNSENGRKVLAAIGKEADLSRKISQNTVAVIVIADAKARYPIELYYTTKYPTIFLVDAKREIPLGSPCIGNASLVCLRKKLLFASTDEYPGAEGR